MFPSSVCVLYFSINLKSTIVLFPQVHSPSAHLHPVSSGDRSFCLLLTLSCSLSLLSQQWCSTIQTAGLRCCSGFCRYGQRDVSIVVDSGSRTIHSTMFLDYGPHILFLKSDICIWQEKYCVVQWFVKLHRKFSPQEKYILPPETLLELLKYNKFVSIKSVKTELTISLPLIFQLSKLQPSSNLTATLSPRVPLYLIKCNVDTSTLVLSRLQKDCS